MPGELDFLSDSNLWSALGSNVGFILVGAILSLYFTVVFERYKTFGGILRDVAQARRHADVYPDSLSDLTRAKSEMIRYRNLLESKRWTLDAEGHKETAAQVGRLQQFAYRAHACMLHMITEQEGGNSMGSYLAAFQIEYSKIMNSDFNSFEETLRPSRLTLLKPYSHPRLPSSRMDILSCDFFSALLD